jgi:hypothetical protein
MKNTTRIAVVFGVVVMAALALVAKQGKSSNSTESKTAAAAPTAANGSATATAPATSPQLPKLLDLGVDIGGKTGNGIVREEPVKPDVRPRDQVCFLCDGDVQPKTRTVVKGASDQHVLCSPHCYFIYLSSIVGADPKAEAAKVSVTDWTSGGLVAATAATYLYGMDARGLPTTKAFGDNAAATKEQQASPGNLIAWEMLRSKELATRCAFCDRAVYPEDACGVKCGTTHGHGCCTHCSMGVAARLKQDIEVEAKDGLTGEPIRVKTLATIKAAYLNRLPALFAKIKP